MHITLQVRAPSWAATSGDGQVRIDFLFVFVSRCLIARARGLMRACALRLVLYCDVESHVRLRAPP